MKSAKKWEIKRNSAERGKKNLRDYSRKKSHLSTVSINGGRIESFISPTSGKGKSLSEKKDRARRRVLVRYPTYRGGKYPGRKYMRGSLRKKGELH